MGCRRLACRQRHWHRLKVAAWPSVKNGRLRRPLAVYSNEIGSSSVIAPAALFHYLMLPNCVPSTSSVYRSAEDAGTGQLADLPIDRLDVPLGTLAEDLDHAGIVVGLIAGGGERRRSDRARHVADDDAERADHHAGQQQPRRGRRRAAAAGKCRQRSRRSRRPSENPGQGRWPGTAEPSGRRR